MTEPADWDIDWDIDAEIDASTHDSCCYFVAVFLATLSWSEAASRRDFGGVSIRDKFEEGHTDVREIAKDCARAIDNAFFWVRSLTSVKESPNVPTVADWATEQVSTNTSHKLMCMFLRMVASSGDSGLAETGSRDH